MLLLIAAGPGPAEPPAGEPLRVLLVDDDRDIHDAIAEVLEDEESLHLELESAFDGADALERMRRRPPHLLILDIRMPVMDGLALREAMLHDEALIDVYVAVFTGSHLSSTELQVLMADDYLPKPPSLPALVAVIEKAQKRVESSEGRQRTRHQRAIDRVRTLIGDLEDLEHRLRARARRRTPEEK